MVTALIISIIGGVTAQILFESAKAIWRKIR